MRISKTLALLSSLSALALGGCSLPDTGPSISAMTATPNVALVNVSDVMAQSMAQISRQQSEDHLRTAIAAISNTGETSEHHLAPGDQISIKLWTFSPFPGAVSSSPSGGNGGLNEADIGVFSVSGAGTVTLPYVRDIHVSGLTMASAQNVISARYTALGILQRPSVSVGPAISSSGTALDEGDSDGLIVTGGVGNPRILPWPNGGMTMARALTLSLGSTGNELQTHNGNDEANGSHPAVSVDVSRGGHRIASIPMDVALEQDIPLQPRDHLIVSRRPAVHVTVLGGGSNKVGNYGFSDTPTLAEVIGESGGLNSNTADDAAIFIYHTQDAGVNGEKPVLYRLAWNKGASLTAAQNFPVQDHDVVVVGEAGIVPVTRILSLIMQAGIIASIAR